MQFLVRKANVFSTQPPTMADVLNHLHQTTQWLVLIQVYALYHYINNRWNKQIQNGIVILSDNVGNVFSSKSADT